MKRFFVAMPMSLLVGRFSAQSHSLTFSLMHEASRWNQADGRALESGEILIKETASGKAENEDKTVDGHRHGLPTIQLWDFRPF